LVLATVLVVKDHLTVLTLDGHFFQKRSADQSGGRPTGAGCSYRSSITTSAVGTRQWNPKLLGYGEIASKLAPGLGKEGSFLGSLLNTKAGEALISGLGAQLLSSLFDKEEVDEGAKRAQRPFGFGDRRVSVNTMRPMANGGTTYPQYFPRRNGGIMPNEGSGKRDDVPAMLMAGEFVLTKDAVKGLGGGNERTGIENAYKMQRKLEGMA
jgi:hypothetical protein